MKKSVYYTGITSTILMLFGCMFKIMHWPGANVMIMLSVFLFCFYFLPVALIVNYKSQEPPKHRSLHIITFFVFFISVMGVLFKVLHWPGANSFLITGLPLPFILFLPAYLYSTRNEKKENNLNFLGIMFGLTFLAVFSVLLALSISKHVLRNAITRDYCIEKTTAFTESAIGGKGAENEIRKNANDLCAYIQDIKIQMLRFTNNDHVIGNPENMWQMYDVDGRAASSQVLFAPEEKNKFDQLRQRVSGFRDKILAEKVDQKLKDLASSLFNVQVVKEMSRNGDINELNWEEREFANKQLIFVLGALSQIQNNVRVVELEYLASLR